MSLDRVARVFEHRLFRERYDVVDRIGSGSFAQVYRAVQRSTGQDVAVKILTLDDRPDADPIKLQIARFKREVQLCAYLRHPNIVRLMDSGQPSSEIIYADGRDGGELAGPPAVRMVAFAAIVLPFPAGLLGGVFRYDDQTWLLVVVPWLVLTGASAAVLRRVVRRSEPERDKMISIHGLLVLVPPILVFLPLMSPRLATVYLCTFVLPLWTMDPRLEWTRALLTTTVVPVRSGDGDPKRAGGRLIARLVQAARGPRASCTTRARETHDLRAPSSGTGDARRGMDTVSVVYATPAVGSGVGTIALCHHELAFRPPRSKHSRLVRIPHLT